MKTTRRRNWSIVSWIAAPPVKPQSPRQPIYLSVKRKASDQPESEPEPEPEVTLYRVGDDKYQGKGCAWMAWPSTSLARGSFTMS